MSKDKLKKIDIKYFLIPLIVLVLIFGIFTYSVVESRIQERYRKYERQALSIAEGYSHVFSYSHEAYETISMLLDEKLLVASKAISRVEGNKDNNLLHEMAEELNLYEISVYNQIGEIIYSNIPENIGWKTYEGHPVHEFMTSDMGDHIEEIRRDSISGEMKKFAYIKLEDGYFIQIGENAEYVYNLRDQFEKQKMVENLTKGSDIHYASFTDNENNVVASTMPGGAGGLEQYKDMGLRDNHVKRMEIDNVSVFLVSVPVIHEGGKQGNLSVFWSTEEADGEIAEMVFNGIRQLIIASLVVSALLYYAFSKNKASVKLAYYDRLTGLPNDNYLYEHLDGILNKGSKRRALLLINCLNFKILNMTHGYTYGDRVLKLIADRIRESLDSEYRVFRFGGDRFILVVEDYSSRDELEHVGKRIVKLFDEPLSLESGDQHILAEVGVVEIRDENMTIDRLLQDATLALSGTGDSNGIPVKFYEETMEEKVRREDRIERVLRDVIRGEEENALHIHYQPKIDIKANKLLGFEALARLYTDDLGHVTPLEFIEIAEKRQIIYELGKEILHSACRYIKELNERGYSNIKVAVNISGLQLLREGFVSETIDIVDSHGLDRESLEFEITESVLLENYKLVNEVFEKIRDIGISISLDDFGTGFSSLSRLRDLNIDIVKIDKQFIDGILVNDKNSLISADIISMAHKLGLAVVAEGVEDDKQMEYLRVNNCDMAQGYYISRPMPGVEAIDFLDRYNK